VIRIQIPALILFFSVFGCARETAEPGGAVSNPRGDVSVVTLADGSYALRPTGEVQAGANAIAAAPGWIEGNTDAVTERPDGGLTIAGWAADINAAVPADRVVVFSGGRSVATGKPGIERADVASHYGKKELSPSGFEIVVPRGVLSDDALDDMRVFAVRNGKVSELNYGFRE
jgi:hypothetical protein